MNCSIMQPTYLPWAGYFNLIASVDKFVFLDDVQFEHQSWQTRNWILLDGRKYMLVVPTRACPLATRIADVQVVQDRPWRVKHWKTLCSAYRKADFGREALNLIEPFYTGPVSDKLSELNRLLIVTISNELSLPTKFFLASELHCDGGRSDHLVQICRALDCSHYLSPQGSREYLAEDHFEELNGPRLGFQEFSPSVYAQTGRSVFVSHLSVIDVLANIGVRGCMKYLKGESP